jgi:hypothetical protein
MNDNCRYVTGGSVILAAAREAGLSLAAAEAVAEGIAAAGYVCVPRVPSREMIDWAYYDALEEDAAGTWARMIEISEDPTIRERTPG